MFYAHYYLTSPESVLVIQVYSGAYLLYEFVFSQKETFNQLVQVLNQVNNDINPQEHPEDSWSPEMISAVFKALK
jgi:hypothetical protein